MEAPNSIQLRPIVPSSDRAYRNFLIASLLMATLVGFVLAIHVPLGRLLNLGRQERTVDLVQAHGQVQLLGFAGLYVMGMSLRLLPRFAGARLAFETLIPFVLWLTVSSLVLRAVLLPWFYGDLHSALLLATSFGLLLGSACFLFIVVATVASARHADASSLAFSLGAWSLFAAIAIGVLAAIDAIGSGARSLPYLTNTAIVQLELLGFLIAFITGVALRAIPAMVGIERPGLGARFLPVLLTGSVALLVAALLYLEYGTYSDAAVRACDAAFLLIGATLLALAWQAGALRPAANRIRPSSQTNLWLIRGAFFWLVVAAVLSIYCGATSFVDGELPSQFEFDAVRHALGVGVITSLILGMSMMILPEFAVERQQSNRQRHLAILLAFLINLAALLRVVPSIAANHWTLDQRNLSFAMAGSAAEVAMLIFAADVIRLIWRTRNL